MADPRGADEIEYDRVFRGAAPAEFKLDWNGRTPERLEPSDVAKLDGEIRGALSAMQFPQKIGGAMMQDALDDARTFVNLDENGQSLWDAQQRANLARIVGPDRIEEAVSNARVMLSIMKPELRKELIDAGLFRSSRVILELHMQAERWLARADMADKRAAKAGTS